MKKLQIKGYPKSDLTVNEFIQLTKKPFFSRGIEERYKRVSDPKYKGFKYSIHYDSSANKLILFVNLYFFVKGEKGTDGKRKTYLLSVKFPYYKDIKTFKKLYNIPIQVFSSDPSFKYYFAYVLNKHNAVILDEETFSKWIKKAIAIPPKKNNPNWKVQLTKHLYKLFKFLQNVHPRTYLAKKWEINIKTRIGIDKDGSPIAF